MTSEVISLRRKTTILVIQAFYWLLPCVIVAISMAILPDYVNSSNIYVIYLTSIQHRVLRKSLIE